MNRMFARLFLLLLVPCVAAGPAPADALSAESPRHAITVDRNDEAGTMTFSIDGREAFAYQYGAEVDLPHYWPLRSPSGKNMLTQMANPYPHHRALWFADTVRLSGQRKASLYNALYSGQNPPEGGPGAKGKPPAPKIPPYRDRIRHVAIEVRPATGDEVTVEKKLVWLFDNDRPLLDEHRTLRLRALGQGEYLLDLTFTLTAAYGQVEFVSDAVHYAWPYLRINETFNGEHGGTITNDRGQQGQQATNMQPARWVDYSNTVAGTAEGLAVFQWPDGREHRWLTREYGTFGPRRPDAQSGKPFTLAKGESITQRVGVLVHRGDVKSGRVAERYRAYVNGDL